MASNEFNQMRAEIATQNIQIADLRKKVAELSRFQQSFVKEEVFRRIMTFTAVPQLKIKTNNLLDTGEEQIGAMEYDGTTLYFTVDDGTGTAIRKIVNLL